MTARSNPSQILRQILVVGGLVLFAGQALPVSLRQAGAAIRSFSSTRSETLAAARYRCFGAYAHGIESIRGVIAPGDDYLLVEGQNSGAHNFVAYDLAPRRAWYLGDATASVEALHKHGRPAGAPRYVVMSLGAQDAPRLVPTSEFFGVDPGP